MKLNSLFLIISSIFGNVTINRSIHVYDVINTSKFSCPSCINPADVNDIDDEDIETDLNTYVDIAGDVMTGNLTLQRNLIMNGTFSNLTLRETATGWVFEVT